MSIPLRRIVVIAALAAWVGATAVSIAAKPADKTARKAARKKKAKQTAPAAVSSVRPNRQPAPRTGARDPLPVALAVDRDIDGALAAAKIPASPAADDAEFIRRASIDILGRIPTQERVSQFLADSRSDKRRRLIDELLADDEFGQNFGILWYHLLVVPNTDNARVIPQTFAQWLADQFNRNRGWDQIVSDILTASGSIDENPATVFWFANSVTNVKPNEVHVKPADALGKVAQRFLGSQIQCAECHNHPFTSFKQTDFWCAAAFLGKLELDNADRKAIRKTKAIPAILELSPGKGTIEIPESNGKVVSAKLPDGALPKKNTDSLRADFAAWVASPTNKSFSQAAANRMWAHFFGRGFVDPVDDFRDDNPPSHPEALRLLSVEFTASGFDLKHLVRCICNSSAYQRSSDALPGNASDESLFSHMGLKAMSSEVLVKSLATALGKDVTPSGKKRGGKKNPRDQFLQRFRTSEEPDLPGYSHGVPQALLLLNGGLMEESPNLQRLLNGDGAPRDIVDKIYLTALSRLPSDAERQKSIALVTGERDRATGYGALLWVLLNSGEFVLNH